jgi:endonuclease G
MSGQGEVYLVTGNRDWKATVRGSMVGGFATCTKAIEIDPDYSTRGGYDPDFLGTGSLRVELPELTGTLVPLAALNAEAVTEPRYVLPYHHFSVVMNRERRLAFFTAVNIDGKTIMRLPREDDWLADPRIPLDSQTDEAIYRKNPLDKGHLVRRLDPAWGTSAKVAKAGNDDTFHFTNCSPQHEDFNQNRTTWAGLEDYVLDNAEDENFRVSVFTGPVLAPDDDEYRGVALPREFWKIVAFEHPSGRLSATAYLLSQRELIEGLRISRKDFSYGAYGTFQVPIRRVAHLTGLGFGRLPASDPLDNFRGAAPAIQIDRYSQVLM